jgi:hypothetical protein
MKQFGEHYYLIHNLEYGTFVRNIFMSNGNKDSNWTHMDFGSFNLEIFKSSLCNTNCWEKRTSAYREKHFAKKMG